MKNRKVKKAIFRSKSEYDLIFCLFKKQIKTVCTCPCVCVCVMSGRPHTTEGGSLKNKSNITESLPQE